MMDRAKLIELIKWYKERAQNTPMPGARAMYQATYDLLKQIRWISVKERLPEDGDLVLVLVDGKPTENITLIGAYQLAVYDPKEKEWILEMWPEWLGAKVTHWMHLPEPPKEGAEE